MPGINKENPSLKVRNTALSSASDEKSYDVRTQTYDEGSTRVLSDIDRGGVTYDGAYESDWLDSVVHNELTKSVQEGRKTLTVPIKGPSMSDYRPETSQAWYNDSVLPAIERTAKRTKSNFKVESRKSGVVFTKEKAAKLASQLAFMPSSAPQLAKTIVEEVGPVSKEIVALIADKLKNSDPENAVAEVESLLKAYSKEDVYAVVESPGNGMVSKPKASSVIQAYKAITEHGVSEQDAIGRLEELGYDKERAASLLSQIPNAVSEGYSLDEISKRFEDIQLTTEETEVQHVNADQEPPHSDTEYWSKTPARKARSRFLSNIDEMSDSEILSGLQSIKPVMTSVAMTDIPSMFGNEAATARYDEALEASRSRILKSANAKGIPLAWRRMPGDTGASLFGPSEQFVLEQEDGSYTAITPDVWAKIGAEKGSIVGGIAGGVLGFMSPVPPIAKVLLGVGGAVIGAASGTQADFLYQSIKLQESLQQDSAAYKALNAVEVSVVGDVVGLGVLKGMGVGWRNTVRLRDTIRSGLSPVDAEYRALKEALFITDDQATDAANYMARYMDIPGEGIKEQSIVASLLTHSKGARVASVLDQHARSTIVKSVNDRAELLLDASSKLTTENAGRVLKQDLANYVGDSKQFYRVVKAVAETHPNSHMYRFDYEKLAIEPILERLTSKGYLDDPAVLETFMFKAERIRTLTEGRSLGDLIELRQVVNDFLFNKNLVKKATDQDAIRSVIKSIDGDIETGARAVMDEPDKWLNSWYDARKTYSTMKRVESNVMFKALNKPGLDEEKIVGILSKYIGAVDGTFNDVLSKLPKEGRNRVEGAVFNAMADKFAVTFEDGTKAMNFPGFADSLRPITFTTKESKTFKDAVLEAADVLKNEPRLAQIDGAIPKPEFTAYLATTVEGRARMGVMTKVTNYIKGKVPGRLSRNAELIKKATKLLENPTNVRFTRDLLDSVDGDPEIARVIRELQEGVTANIPNRESVELTFSGSGKVLKASEDGEVKIAAYRIATVDEARAIADANRINMASDSLDTYLISVGYKAIMEGSDRVRLLK